MNTQKPWAPVLLGESTGRFTREQIRDAVLSVKAEREAAAAAGRPWVPTLRRSAKLRATGIRVHVSA
ncbi:MAG TPA: hypothetical protein VFR81_24875 [Longimicrobium sp.]|nr:hypothetical protein [Longimicrobium sp.]